MRTAILILLAMVSAEKALAWRQLTDCWKDWGKYQPETRYTQLQSFPAIPNVPVRRNSPGETRVLNMSVVRVKDPATGQSKKILVFSDLMQGHVSHLEQISTAYEIERVLVRGEVELADGVIRKVINTSGTAFEEGVPNEIADMVVALAGSNLVTPETQYVAFTTADTGHLYPGFNRPREVDAHSERHRAIDALWITTETVKMAVKGQAFAEFPRAKIDKTIEHWSVITAGFSATQLQRFAPAYQTLLKYRNREPVTSSELQLLNDCLTEANEKIRAVEILHVP